ncbi:MAG: 50S ribosomal protein L23 [bacterium]|nr:50S ribosomal protein L23 [bacterium]
MGIFDRFKKDQRIGAPARKQEAPVKHAPKKTSEQKVVSAPAKEKSPSAKAMPKHVRPDRFVVRPIVTEKSTGLQQLNKYVFEVPVSANRIEVAKSVHALYGVTPVKVHMMVRKGKNVTYGRTAGRTKDWKRAIVTLRAGESIQTHEGV